MGNLLKKYKAFPVQAKASFWFLMCAFLQKGISSITTPIFTRLLTTEEYGKFGVFNSWSGIVTIFVTLNLYYGVYSQGLVKFGEDRSVFSSSMEGLIFTLTLIFTVAYGIFHNFFNSIFHLTTVQMLAMLLMIWTSAVFNLWSQEQRVEFKYKALVIISLVVTVLKPAIGVVFVIYAEDKVTARILGLALVELLGYSALFFIQMKRGRVFYSSKYWLYALKFNIPLIPHYLSTTVLSSSDRIMIEDMSGSGDAGIYNLAYSVALIMTIFNNSLMQTISPWLYQKIKENRIQNVSKIAYTTLILIGAVNITLILFAPEVIRIFAPPEYEKAIWVIPPVAMSVYFMYSYDLFAKFAFYYEKTVFIMFASSIGAILNIVLNYLFIPVFGFIAAGYTTLICYIVFSMIHYIFMRKVCKDHCEGVMPYQTKIIMMISLSFLMIGFLLMFTYVNAYIRYGTVLVLLILSFKFRKKLITEIQTILSLKQNKA